MISVGTKHISRQQWDQIESRVKKSNFTFDPKWKCLLDGLPYGKCYDHNDADQEEIIQAVQKRINGSGI